MSASPLPKLFISYRREDAAGHAGRLYDALSARFGERQVFMDMDIEPGVDFVERITQAVSRCHVLVVVIGPEWASVRGPDGRRRLEDPNDFVRLEAATGLRRDDVTVIPALVGGARMPRAGELPGDLDRLTRRNAIELSDARWRYDVGRLLGVLEEQVGSATAVHEPAPAPAPTTPASAPATPLPPSAPAAGEWLRWAIAGVLGIALAGLAARWLGHVLLKPHVYPRPADQILAAAARQAITWGLVGAAMGVALGLSPARRRVRAGLVLGGLWAGGLSGAAFGAVASTPVAVTSLNASQSTKDLVAVGALVLVGASLGAWLGARWRPPNRGRGLLAGAAGAAVAQALAVWVTGYEQEAAKAWATGLAAACILGAVVLAELGPELAAADEAAVDVHARLAP